MKIHLGCGRHVLPDYVNVDAVARLHWPAPQILHQMHPDNPLPFEDGSATEILAVHLFEHFHPWEARKLLKDWHRVLAPGGRIVLEMPDIMKCAKNLLSGSDWSMSMFGLYGDPQTEDHYMSHKWGWHPASIEQELKLCGFTNISFPEPQWHRKGRYNRDMRAEGRK